MKPDWKAIVEALRQELADYGGLLHLLEEQQRLLLERDAEAVLRLGDEIEVQARGASDCRKKREAIVSAFALAQGEPANATMRALLPFIEPDFRPLVEALVNEVNRLVHRVRRTSRHNHELIARAVEFHQEALQQLRPASFTKTYSAAGLVSVAGAGLASTLRTAG